MGLELFGLDASAKSIWFGSVALMVVEIGLITLPMGMNLFIVLTIILYTGLSAGFFVPHGRQ